MNIERRTLNAEHRITERGIGSAFDVRCSAFDVSRFCKSVTTETINRAMMPTMKTESAFAGIDAGAQRTPGFIRGFSSTQRLQSGKIVFLASLLLCVFALLPLGLCAATNDLTTALQQGLFEEEANRNLDAAISNYQSLATQFDQDRQIAATAIFRLGECYRKLGQTNAAVVQYERIVHEFSDQQTLATLSQQNLTGLGTTPQASSHSATTSESAAKTAELEAEAAALKAQIAHLSGLNREDRRTAIQQNFPNPVLTTLMQQLNEAEQNLASLTNDYTPTDLHVSRVIAQVSAINGQIDTQVEGVIKGLQAKMEADIETAEIFRAQTGSTPSARAESSPTTDNEGQEIQRIQQMLQNSPDLINAPDGSGHTPLEKAAINGWIKVAAFLLNHGADVNAGKSSALNLAANAGNRAMVEFLLGRGADINAKAWQGKTPLHTAVEEGFQAVTEVLLANKADVNAQDNSGDMPLHLAAQRGQKKIVQMLLAAGAAPNAENKPGRTPLSFAVGSGSLEAVKMLLAAGANPNLKDSNDKTPLNYAIVSGSPEIIQALLGAGAANTEEADGRTPLSYAMEKNNPTIVKMLLAAKADPNGGKLDAPLFCAIKGGNTNMVELLLRAGANPNLPGRLDRQVVSSASDQTITLSPLECSMSQDQPAITRLLLQFKADPNGQDTSKQPFIFRALFNLDILKAMLEAGADPNSVEGNPNGICSQGESPLMVAAKNRFTRSSDGNSYSISHDGDPAVAKLLIEHGANVNARRPLDGATVLHLAVQSGNREIVELLLANKADVNARNNDGLTPLDLVKNKLLPNAAPSDKTNASEIADLLRQHGALDNLPHWDRITVSRPSANYSETVFRKGTNDWNQISLFDVLGVQYELISNSQSEPQRGNSVPYSYYAGNNSLSFPDLANIIIRRATADGKGWENRTIDLTSALNSGNCAADFQLRWGDVVEIPEKDHVLNERWPGLSTNELFTLKNCLTRHLQISVKGQITNIVITPQVKELVPGSREYPLSSYGAKMEPAVILLKFEPFMLWPVLKDSKLLLASSDLSHIKVKRRDTTTGKMHEWMVDCSNPQAPPNLWLRDGDVIEVPEK
jgi:cytohesin